jgi:hypothetical protein
VWAAYLYIAFYAVTDHIAGIGNGVVMLRSDAASTSERPEIDWRFDVANDVGGSGTWALALAAVATAVVALRVPCCWCCRAGTSPSPEYTSTGPAEFSPWW